MADYVVSFLGHIIEAFRPEGFPKIVKHDVMVRADGLAGLQNAINSETAELYVKRKCFIVPKDPGAIEEVGSTQIDSRILIPIHMVAFIETSTKKLAQDVPDEVDMTGENGPKVYQQ
jgi:hypothetical protein